MKQFLFIVMATLLSNFIFGQGKVGVNTANPQTTLHVDGAKDNPALGTPSATQMANDVVVTSDGKLGIGTITPNASAVLEAKASDKGILIPKVALSAANVAAPVTAPAEGLLVYNTTNGGSYPNEVFAGNFYYWYNNKWYKVGANDQPYVKGVISPTDFTPPLNVWTYSGNYIDLTPGVWNIYYSGKVRTVNSLEFTAARSSYLDCGISTSTAALSSLDNVELLSGQIYKIPIVYAINNSGNEFSSYFTVIVKVPTKIYMWNSASGLSTPATFDNTKFARLTAMRIQ